MASKEGKMVSAGFMPAGPQLAATQMTTKRSLLSVRFIRAEAAILSVSAITCFRWHKANGELETIGDKVAANCCLRPDKPDGRQFELVTDGTKMVLKKSMSTPNF